MQLKYIFIGHLHIITVGFFLKFSRTLYFLTFEKSYRPFLRNEESMSDRRVDIASFVQHLFDTNKLCRICLRRNLLMSYFTR